MWKIAYMKGSGDVAHKEKFINALKKKYRDQSLGDVLIGLYRDMLGMSYVWIMYPSDVPENALRKRISGILDVPYSYIENIEVRPYRAVESLV